MSPFELTVGWSSGLNSLTRSPVLAAVQAVRLPHFLDVAAPANTFIDTDCCAGCEGCELACRSRGKKLGLKSVRVVAARREHYIKLKI